VPHKFLLGEDDSMFLRDTAGVAEHMRKHRAIIAPKFAALFSWR